MIHVPEGGEDGLLHSAVLCSFFLSPRVFYFFLRTARVCRCNAIAPLAYKLDALLSRCSESKSTFGATYYTYFEGRTTFSLLDSTSVFSPKRIFPSNQKTKVSGCFSSLPFSFSSLTLSSSIFLRWNKVGTTFLRAAFLSLSPFPLMHDRSNRPYLSFFPRRS